MSIEATAIWLLEKAWVVILGVVMWYNRRQENRLDNLEKNQKYLISHSEAKEFLGCGYDYFGVFGFLVRMNLSTSKRYQYAEFIAACLDIDEYKCYKATPQGIWLYLGKTIQKGI